ncbi:aldehyde dehydrogenase family protein [Bacillus licheniformis]|nr:aldehyde dehydrogenase family protein [Bacillus licheniformis]
MAPWNYPFQLAVSPLIGALAAGNTAVIKPSELAPAVSTVISEMIKDIFPPEYVSVIEGGVKTNQELLRQNLTISFYGQCSRRQSCHGSRGKQLIPVTLELGGKAPASCTRMLISSLRLKGLFRKADKRRTDLHCA